MTITIREIFDSDLDAVAEVHALSFVRQKNSLVWIRCNLGAYPRMRYFVAVHEKEVIGYILWTEKSGFRKEVMLELEQIAILPNHRNNGIATELIRQSLLEVAKVINSRGDNLAGVMVTTRADNLAQQLYQKALGAEVVAVIPALFEVDEGVMVSHDPIFRDNKFTEN